MIFHELSLADAYAIELEKREDERGFFARTWCQRDFMEVIPDADPVQANCSFNVQSGTLRGLHYQVDPHAETKLIRCTRGSIFDVIVDFRPDSPTFHKWVGLELSAQSGRMMFVPRHFAHGFQTLEDDTEVVYQSSAFYAPDAERGLRWDDPALNIQWPLPVEVISPKDQSWPLIDRSAAA